jgi:hypothetical protein
MKKAKASKPHKSSAPKSHKNLAKKDVIRVLGFDVGKANPAWAVYDIPKVGKPKAVAFSVAHYKITNFSSDGFIEQSKGGGLPERTKSFSGQVADLNTQTDTLIDDYSIDFAVIERFQNRGFGRTGGEASEFCGVIVGALSSRIAARGIPFALIMAGTWKTQFNNKYKGVMQVSKAQDAKPLEALYKQTFSPHVTDACLMAIYSGMKLHGNTPFEDFQLEWIKELMK